MERLRLEDVDLAYEDTGGGGPAVLFVHGLGGSAYSWRAQTAACSEAAYRAVAFDQRGAGLSSKPPGPYSVELWAEDVERLLDGLGIERAALVGQSVGCMIAEQAALQLGERCRALAMIGGALRWRPEAGPVFEQRVALARAGRMDEIAEGVATTGLSEQGRSGNPALHGLFLDLIASNDAQSYGLWAEATAGAEMKAPDRVDCPALALAGEHDPVTPPDAAAALAAGFPNGRSTTVQGAAHWCQIEAPQAVNDALIAFFGENAT